MDNPDFTFYSSPDYFEDLCGRIDATNSGDRVAIMTMSINTQAPPIHDLLRSLTAAAKRGVSVIAGIDAFSFIHGQLIIPGPLFVFKDLPQKIILPFYRHNLEALEELKANGGHYKLINLPRHRFTPSFIGRSHIKHAIVNNRVYIGG